MGKDKKANGDALANSVGDIQQQSEFLIKPDKAVPKLVGFRLAPIVEGRSLNCKLKFKASFLNEGNSTATSARTTGHGPLFQAGSGSLTSAPALVFSTPTAHGCIAVHTQA